MSISHPHTKTNLYDPSHGKKVTGLNHHLPTCTYLYCVGVGVIGWRVRECEGVGCESEGVRGVTVWGWE